MRHFEIGLTAAALLTTAPWSAGARAQEPAPESPARPKYSLLRWEEDWSVLARMPEGAETDPWDAIKYVPLDKSGSIWASFGGHARLRVENWRHFNFLDDADDTFLLTRLMLHGDLHIGPNVRLFVEGKSSLSTDRDLPGGRRTLDVDTIDLEQGFADVRLDLARDTSLTFRPGRQALSFGRERLVSPLDWSNTLRRWDGVSAILRSGSWSVTGFWTQFVPVQKYDFNDADAQNELFGVYATGRVWDAGPGLDLYVLGQHRDDPITFNATTGEEERYTLGARVSGALGETGFDYDLEGAYQLGEVGSADVDAWMLGTEVGWKAGEWWATPRFFAGFDLGSGDENPGGDVGTFNQLFPLGHAYLGYIDVVGRQNVRGANLGVTIAPAPGLTVGLTGHFFWRDETADALYDAGGNVVRAGSLGSSREIGQEIDLTVRYRFDAHITSLFGYSYFFAGDFIDESGQSNDISFAYAQIQYTF